MGKKKSKWPIVWHKNVQTHYLSNELNWWDFWKLLIWRTDDMHDDKSIGNRYTHKWDKTVVKS